MGYTHYWTMRSLNDTEWALLSELTRALLARPDVAPLVCEEFDVPTKPPIVSENLIRFNGKGDAGHETLYLARPDDDWSFCKTARKPYDVAVVAFLCFLGHLGCAVSSDGDADDWGAGRLIALEVAEALDVELSWFPGQLGE